MATTHRLIEWTDAHRDVAFDLIRIYLGIGLLVRGWLFILDSTAVVNLLADSGDPTFISAAVVHYVALAHFGGGLLLAVGLLTRVAALVQIPVLVGAVFFVHLNEGLLEAGQSLEFSALVLFLLVLIFFHGSGRLSLDYYLFERESAEAARAAQYGLLELSREEVLRRELQRDAEVRQRVAAGPGGDSAAATQAVSSALPKVCTCGASEDRNSPNVRVERRYGMRALRFITGTTGTPKEIVFRCRKCGDIVDVSTDESDLAYYTYR
jgi:uncharacterized membrane protein YphA (DoxX/SURF4 family)